MLSQQASPVFIIRWEMGATTPPALIQREVREGGLETVYGALPARLSLNKSF